MVINTNNPTSQSTSWKSNVYHRFLKRLCPKSFTRRRSDIHGYTSRICILSRTKNLSKTEEIYLWVTNSSLKMVNLHPIKIETSGNETIR